MRRFIETKIERLQGQLSKINSEIAQVQGLRRASLYIKRDALLEKIAKAKGSDSQDEQQ